MNSTRTTTTINVDPLDLARVREAWEEAVSRTGQVGSMDVTVAIIEPQGFDLTHPDLYRNIYLNQGEIPQCLRAVLTDCDPAGGDGLITIRDLECEENAPFRPADVNANSLIDAEDLIQPFASPGCEVGDNGGVTGWTGGGWADGIDDDPVAGDENAVFVDDIAGWDFGLGSNDAGSITPVGNRLPHATTVAGIIGAEGDNGIGTAGSLWRVSIVPLLANASNIDLATISDVNLSAAIDYVEARGFDIVNISAGWQFFLSNYGSRVTVFAAGGPWQGVAPASSVALVPASTSFAAPQLAGAAALLLSVEPAFKHDGAALKAALVSSAGKLLDATCSKGDAPIPLPVQPVLDARALLEETP